MCIDADASSLHQKNGTHHLLKKYLRGARARNYRIQIWIQFYVSHRNLILAPHFLTYSTELDLFVLRCLRPADDEDLAYNIQRYDVIISDATTASTVFLLLRRTLISFSKCTIHHGTP
jgi:hypothetical protein